MRVELLAQLEQASGRRSGGDLNPFYEWLWAREPDDYPDYAEFKAALYEQVDPRFREYFGRDRKAALAVKLDSPAAARARTGRQP